MNTNFYSFVFATSTPIVKLVDEIINRAEKFGASDIHIDPQAEDVRVRFRIDGVLHDVCKMSLQTHGEFVARVKIISGLRIDERIVPQDGRLTVGDNLDIRITIIASYYGESIVMRLLRRTAVISTLENLGFSQRNQEIIQKGLKSKQGLILVTGPTGSGKTTTLYSLLDLVADSSVSTVTIEDPVEYAIRQARQISVQQKRGINFANGLRSILRQDPDVIMVGEIRDHETAAIATSAALTGHLVLSTLHTNDAVSTIVRFIEMGIEPYLVAATLRLVISQRLVRKLCSECKKEVKISDNQVALLKEYNFDFASVLKIYMPAGCEKCSGTGYLGRTVVSEILPITPELSQKIVERDSVKMLATVAVDAGMEMIAFQVLNKFAQGITSFDETIKILHQ